MSITKMIGMIGGWVRMMMSRRMTMRRRMIKMIKILTRMMGLIRGWVRKPMGSLRGDGTC